MTSSWFRCKPCGAFLARKANLAVGPTIRGLPLVAAIAGKGGDDIDFCYADLGRNLTKARYLQVPDLCGDDSEGPRRAATYVEATSVKVRKVRNSVIEPDLANGCYRQKRPVPPKSAERQAPTTALANTGRSPKSRL
jgi:hypothetical protein